MRIIRITVRKDERTEAVVSEKQGKGLLLFLHKAKEAVAQYGRKAKKI